jgi:hypothetical protein
MEQNVTDHFPCLGETQPRHRLRLLAWHAPGPPPPAHMPTTYKQYQRSGHGKKMNLKDKKCNVLGTGDRDSY